MKTVFNNINCASKLIIPFRKDTRLPTKATKKRNRVAALCIGVGADGVVESIYESYRAESLSQL